MRMKVKSDFCLKTGPKSENCGATWSLCPVVERYYFSLAATPLPSIHGTWVDSYIEMLNGTGIRIFTGTLLPWYMKLVYGLSTMARHESPTVGGDHLQTVLTIPDICLISSTTDNV